jgi:hypothetical protein
VSTFRLVGIALISLFLLSCETTKPSPQVVARNAQIAQEAPGDYFIGRRYYIPSTRFWGWVRRPRETWDHAKLVIMSESHARTPDRLPEEPLEGMAHGYDNNAEYKIRGHYTNTPLYDPNSNLILPEFMLTDIQLISRNPGFLFDPKERWRPDAVTIMPRTGVPQVR